MLYIIKSPPGTPEAHEAVRSAAMETADLVLLGEACGFALRDMLDGFCGTAFALDSDLDEYLPQGAELEKGVKVVSAEELEGMLSAEEHSGPF